VVAIEYTPLNSPFAENVQLLSPYKTRDYRQALLTLPLAKNVQLLGPYKTRDYRQARLTLPLAENVQLLSPYKTRDYRQALLTLPLAENVQLLSPYKTRDYRQARLTLPLAKGELEGVPTSATAYPDHQTCPESWTSSARGEVQMACRQNGLGLIQRCRLLSGVPLDFGSLM
jgi:hypothetical protein